MTFEVRRYDELVQQNHILACPYTVPDQNNDHSLPGISNVMHKNYTPVPGCLLLWIYGNIIYPRSHTEHLKCLKNGAILTPNIFYLSKLWWTHCCYLCTAEWLKKKTKQQLSCSFLLFMIVVEASSNEISRFQERSLLMPRCLHFKF